LPETWSLPHALVLLEPLGWSVYLALFPLSLLVPCSIFPIDMVKTRLIEQIGQPQRLYSGPVDCARKIIARDGFKGLYRGLKVNFIGVMPEKAIKLAVNDACRNHFLQQNNGGAVTIAQGCSVVPLLC
jgi:hypothetical protein